MPPEVTQYCHSLITPRTPLLSKSRCKRILHQKYCQGVGRRMKFTKKKIIPILVFVLCGASIFRFLNISRIANFSVTFPSIYQPECSSASSICRKNISYSQVPSQGRSMSMNSSSLTEKETLFISQLVSQRVPCNILVFGNAYQYSRIASLNAGGVTIFLEDYLDNTTQMKPANNTQVHKIMYNTTALNAYQMLKDARRNPDCMPKLYLPQVSKCNLVLSNLPMEVYDTMWDVVMVDGPSGGTPNSPGRMASIYTASILARRGNETHVIIHDVDRMIEKWFSWEFLCEENLVSSKGRFWHFQIIQLTNATTFCTP